ncbi:MAG: hypothetical protein ACYC7E_01300 [Armatimonadota bacterium]
MYTFDLPHSRCATSRTNDVHHVFSLFPPHLQRRIRRASGGVWIWETPWLPSYYGIVERGMRCGSKLMDSNQAAWFNPDDCIIYMPDTMGNQVLLHEFGHLLDHALAKDGYFYYTTSKDFHHLWKQGSPINWYAARNPREYFAEGVTAYLLQELAGRTDDGRQIDRGGLRKQDPVLFSLLENIFSDPELAIVYGR